MENGILRVKKMVDGLDQRDLLVLILHKLTFLEGVCATNQLCLAQLMTKGSPGEAEECVKELSHQTINMLKLFQGDLEEFVSELRSQKESQ